MATIDVHLHPDELAAALRADVRAGLTATPKAIPPQWLYDQRGSALFEEITRLPEYYPFRAEREILAARGDEIAKHADATVLVELGSGTSEKTRRLLDALRARGPLEAFVPFDVSEATLRVAADQLEGAFPGLRVHGVVGDFHRHLALLPQGGRRLIAFLGGTIGNLDPAGRAGLLQALVATMGPHDSFLVGTDLVKDPDRLVAAYDDPAGVSAAFARNLLTVIDRELDADADPDRFAYVARWDAEHEWIEMAVRSELDQVVHVRALELAVPFAAGEELRTEISAKFRLSGPTPGNIGAELGAAGLTPVAHWTDRAGDFALTLATLRGAT